jgi:protein-tyrosine-phosphatase
MEHFPGEKDRKLPGAVLFMCGQNSIRSPMAEAIARHYLPSSVYVASAGVKRGERDPFVDVVLDEIGLTLGRHQPHVLDDLEDDYFDLIVTLAPEAHHAALDLTRSGRCRLLADAGSDRCHWHARSDSRGLPRRSRLSHPPYPGPACQTRLRFQLILRSLGAAIAVDGSRRKQIFLAQDGRND